MWIRVAILSLHKLATFIHLGSIVFELDRVGDTSFNIV